MFGMNKFFGFQFRNCKSEKRRREKSGVCVYEKIFGFKNISLMF